MRQGRLWLPHVWLHDWDQRVYFCASAWSLFLQLIAFSFAIFFLLWRSQSKKTLWLASHFSSFLSLLSRSENGLWEGTHKVRLERFKPHPGLNVSQASCCSLAELLSTLWQRHDSQVIMRCIFVSVSSYNKSLYDICERGWNRASLQDFSRNKAKIQREFIECCKTFAVDTFSTPASRALLLRQYFRGNFACSTCCRIMKYKSLENLL